MIPQPQGAFLAERHRHNRAVNQLKPLTKEMDQVYLCKPLPPKHQQKHDLILLASVQAISKFLKDFPNVENNNFNKQLLRC